MSRWGGPKARVKKEAEEQRRTIAKRQPPKTKEVEFHKVKPEGVTTFRQQQRDRQMTDTNVPTTKPSGSVFAPLLRSGIRYVVGVVMGALLSLLVTKGIIGADLITKAQLDAFLNSPQIMGLISAVALASAGAVEAIWLNARKSGKST